jgi:hypothetical protein
MIRIPLSEAEAQRLEQAFRSATDHKLRDRLNVVRLAQPGRQRQDIAHQLGLSTRPVQLGWRNGRRQGPVAWRRANRARAFQGRRRWRRGLLLGADAAVIPRRRLQVPGEEVVHHVGDGGRTASRAKQQTGGRDPSHALSSSRGGYTSPAPDDQEQLRSPGRQPLAQFVRQRFEDQRQLRAAVDLLVALQAALQDREQFLCVHPLRQGLQVA